MKLLFAPMLLLAMLVSTSSAVEAAPTTESQKIINHLQDISVTIKAQSGGWLGGESQGSGVLFTRKDGDDTTSYVWTAAHVVDGLKSRRPVLINGSLKIVTEFKDAQVVCEFQEDGRRVGETTVDARVIRYSDAETGRDLAILQIRKKNFAGEKRSAEFYSSVVMPTVGTKLYHVGSLLGQFGSNSLTQGAISQTGRVLDIGASGTVFDQTSVTAFPGSSGGGVFLESNGQYVGMLVRGAGEQFNFIVPIREMRTWATDAKVLWALDRNVPLPSAEALKKLPIEDAGVTFETEKDDAEQTPAQERYEKVNQQFPFLLNMDAPSASSSPFPNPNPPAGDHSPAGVSCLRRITWHVTRAQDASPLAVINWPSNGTMSSLAALRARRNLTCVGQCRYAGDITQWQRMKRT